MAKLKDAFYHSIMYEADILEQKHADGTVDVELADEMLETIHRLEYELALYHAGCEKKEVDKMMKKTYRTMKERIA